MAARHKKQKPQKPPSSSEESSSSEEEEQLSSEEESENSNDDQGNEDESEDEEQPATFSDQNSKWLKSKKQKLMDSSSEEENDENDDEEDDDDELLEVEREARELDEEIEAEEAEAEAEMRKTVTEQTEIYHLPTPEEIAQETDRVVPPSEMRSHIDSILEVLADFRVRREVGRSRKEYIDTLCHFLAELYGYIPELVEYFLTMFSPEECVEFIDASDKPRPLVIRTNTLKTRRKDLAAALMKRGVTLDPLSSWSKVGLKIIESPVPIGATPEYLGGHYMLQSAASMCSVMALAPEPNEKCLDMSAAPGGKTSYMAQLMKNTGSIIANDLKRERQKATVANMHRLGVRNVITCTHDGRKLGTVFKNRFDRILLDAPCSGLGVISRDPSCKVQRTIEDVRNTARLQKELLLAAIDALKYKGTTGGFMVYSTCSVSVAENEEVVNYALSKRDIQIVDTGLDFGREGFTRYQDKRFHPSLSKTRRFYPHVHNMDGFFVARIKKLSDKHPGEDNGAEKDVQEEIVKEKVQMKSEQNSGTKKVKKLKRKFVDDIQKKTNVSVPPRHTKVKKDSNNAKTAKPRRMKKSIDQVM